MAEKKEDLPPAYTNLGYDAEHEAGPSAPSNSNDSKFKEVDAEHGAGPSAPSILENSTFKEDLQQEFVPPSAPVPELNLGPTQLVYDPPSLVFEEIYDACANYVKQHCCYGSRFINQMKLIDISNKGVFHYKLESYGEKRESANRETPYRGGPIDGPENGPPPRPWDMFATPPAHFVNYGTTIDIPHTETVHTCYKCRGSGKVTCSSCNGRGKKDCWRCSGRGKDNEDNRCIACSGSGRERCSRCSGSGRVTCSKCSGYGKLKEYRVLIVTWKNHPTDFITNTGNMPSELLPEASGITLFTKKDAALQPLLNAPEETVNAASVSLLETHRNAFPNEMIIQQRHTLRAVPFARVTYKWKNKDGEFYVYGRDRQVYFEVYPQRCCCCTCC